MKFRVTIICCNRNYERDSISYLDEGETLKVVHKKACEVGYDFFTDAKVHVRQLEE